mmetsp:Transcript_676/g.2397  ORF Transcript_676/g.2397 Transcript_676/m.2397 type:complete len:315 (-) Transcript_676:52-996(-)
MSAGEGSVCVVGACNVDLIAYVPRLPAAGETLKGTLFEQGFGGKGANQAVQAALLGSKDVVFISKVGCDGFGSQFREKLASYGIPLDYVSVHPSLATGVAPIAVTKDGENSIIIVPGANDELTVADIDEAKDAIGKCKVMLVQLELPLELSWHAMKVAHAQGVQTILNTAPAPSSPLPEEIYEHVSVLCANQPEVEMLTGMEAKDTASAEAAARKVIEMGANSVILTLGSNGCMLIEGDGKAVHIPATKVEKVVDTTGAGDSYLGALSHFLALAAPVKAAMAKANAVAGMSVQKRGTQSSYPSASDLSDDFFSF